MRIAPADVLARRCSALRAELSSRTLDALGPVDSDVVILTELQVREDGWTLFGFGSAGERETFRILTGVQGVGGRVALAILSTFTPDELARAGKARFHLFLDVGNAGRSGKRREPVDQRDDLVVLRSRLHHTRPSHHHRDAHAAFPCRAFLTVERRLGAVWPQRKLGAVVGGVEDDRVVGDAEIVELLEQLADHFIVLRHAVGVKALAGLAN